MNDIRIDFESIEEAAAALKALKGKISGYSFDVDFTRTQGGTKERIVALVDTLKDTQRNVLELVTNTQATLTYLSDAFEETENEAAGEVGRIGVYYCGRYY